MAVYAVVARIPAGQVATYGLVAFLAGRPRASRIVGCALARAPEGLPCHRVLYRDGASAPRTCSAERASSACCWKERASPSCPMAGWTCPVACGTAEKKGAPHECYL